MVRALVCIGFLVVCSVVQAQSRSVYIEDLTWPEVRDALAAGRTTAIIYIGSTEQNGPHMALGKHNFVAHHVGGQIAEKLGNALVYPVLPFALAGDPTQKTGHMRFPGTVSLSSELFVGVVRQIAHSAISAGFKNVFLMGDHGGGQAELNFVAERLDNEWRSKGVRAFYVPDLYFKSAKETATYLVARGIPAGEHAGASDTSQIMFLNEARWIRHDKLAASDASQRTTTGVDGDPTGSTAEMGRTFIDFKVNNAVAQIQNLLGGKQ